MKPRIRLQSERAVALPVAMAVLLIVSILVAAIAATAMQSSDNANRDRDSKRALSAAEAGLQMAVFRLNTLKPASGNCLTNVGVPPLPGGECPGHTESIGNGAQYTYHVTPVLSGGACGSIPGQTGSNERCITSLGIADGVTRRVQTRVATTSATTQLFGDAGVIGLDLVQLGNSNEFEGSIGSNLQVTLGNSAEVDPGSILLPPGGNYTCNSCKGADGGVQPHLPWVLPPVDFIGPAASNNNSVIPGAYYDSSNRTLTMGNSVEYSMPAGTYSFCRVSLGNSVKWKFPASGVVKIYIDSPARTGSGCAPGTGRFISNNSIELNKEAGKPENLEIYVYGTRDEAANASINCNGAQVKHDFMLCNSNGFNGTVYAPDSTVFLGNSSRVNGGFASKRVIGDNSVKYSLPDSIRNKAFDLGVPGVHARKGWFECREKPTNPSDPESGC